MKDQKQNDLKYQIMKSTIDQYDKQVPIRRGCPNGQCFCTGKCQEIVGWREKTMEEKFRPQRTTL